MYVEIGTTKYRPIDFAMRRRVLDHLGSLPGGHAAALGFLFGVPADAWTFPNENAFYRAINIFADTPEAERTPTTLPNMLTVARRRAGTVMPGPGGALLPGGTTTLAGVRYADSAALALAGPVTALLALEATLRHPGLTRIVDDPLNGYAFTSWAALTEALGTWNGLGALPVAVRAARIPIHPVSALSNYDPTDTVTAENLRLQEARYVYAWGSCGMTGQHLTARIHDLGGDIQREDEVTFGQGQGAALRQLLLAPVAVRTLYEIHNPMLHHFVIEKRPSDQGAILQQGYIGAYWASWWAGLTGGLSVREEGNHEIISAMRTFWGGGRTIDLGVLGTRLGAFLAQPRMSTAGSAEAWRNLPFLPWAVIALDNPATWVVTTWSVAAPNTVFNAVEDRLHGDYPQEWVTETVMREAAEYETRIEAVRTLNPRL
ncbi:hypothetical protein ACIA8F_24085 [Streptomyces sp. NPDC051563]|uniref:hypothetical protein n=1 Tax=Streptomyces sp. NPDC051563 TaxID=3365659 RepID=UPI0037B3D090